MKAAVLQMNTAFARPKDNLAALPGLVAEAMAAGPDVLLLPELWQLGFYPRPIRDYADPDGRETRETLAALARKHRVNIVGGTAARLAGDGLVYNTSYVLDRSGKVIASYDKAHLFSPSGEDKDFAAGSSACVFELEGVGCALAICYDIRFGAFIERLAREGADILFLPAAWPLARLTHWQTLLRARAIEQQFFVVAANGAGGQTEQPLAGHSAIIDPWGTILAEAGEAQAIISAELDMALLRQARESLPVRRDRRGELYNEAEDVPHFCKWGCTF